MKIDMFKDYKTVQPIDTIMKVREEMCNIGLTIREAKWFNPINNVFSCQVEIADSSLTSWGKGVTANYSLASAYGELIEELNTGLYFSDKQYSKNAIDYLGFRIDPYEIKSKLDLINLPESFKLSKPFEDNTSLFDVWEANKLKENQSRIMLPYKDILNDENVRIPSSVISMLNGSNGLCAGNSREEALIHGLSEIFERYIIKKIFLSKSIIPTVSQDTLKTNFPISYHLIKEVESTTNFRIIVKDCTFANTYPVMAIQVFDKSNNEMAVNFGADPDLDLALHRCITEIYQMSNDMYYKMMSFSPFFDEEVNIDRYHRFVKNGSGAWPFEFFITEEYSKPSINYGISKNDKFNYLLKTFEINGAKSIYVRDCSYIALKSYQIAIPGFSEVFVLSDFYKNFDNLESRFDDMKRISELNDRELKQLTIVIDNHLNFVFHGQRGFIQDFLTVKFDHDIWDKITLDYLQFSVFIKLRNYVEAKKYLEIYIEHLGEIPIESMHYFNCLVEILNLLLLDVSIDTCQDYLTSTYDLEIIADAIELIKNSDSILDTFPKINCFDCDNCDNYMNCQYKENEELYMKIKDYKYSLFNKEKQND